MDLPRDVEAGLPTSFLDRRVPSRRVEKPAKKDASGERFFHDQPRAAQAMGARATAKRHPGATCRLVEEIKSVLRLATVTIVLA